MNEANVEIAIILLKQVTRLLENSLATVKPIPEKYYAGAIGVRGSNDYLTTKEEVEKKAWYQQTIADSPRPSYS